MWNTGKPSRLATTAILFVFSDQSSTPLTDSHFDPILNLALNPSSGPGTDFDWLREAGHGVDRVSVEARRGLYLG